MADEERIRREYELVREDARRVGTQRYTLDALAAHTGFSPRAIRKYIHLRIIPPATGRGGGTRYAGVGWYTQEHIRALLRLRAILDTRMNLDDIRDRMNPEDSDDE